MTATFKHTGDAIDYTPPGEVAAGTVVVQGDLVGVTKLPIKAGDLGSLHVAGVFDFPKTTGAGTAIPVGSSLYWDEAEQVAKVDSESGANKLIGKSIAEATDDATVVRARMNQ